MSDTEKNEYTHEAAISDETSIDEISNETLSNDELARKTELNSLIYEFHRLILRSGYLVSKFSAKTELSNTECEALLLLWQAQQEGELLKISDIAEHLGLTRAGATKLVDRLETKKYISRNPDAKDRRTIRLIVSHTGSEVGNDFMCSAENFHCDKADMVFADRSIAQIKLFKEMLAEISNLIFPDQKKVINHE